MYVILIVIYLDCSDNLRDSLHISTMSCSFLGLISIHSTYYGYGFKGLFCSKHVELGLCLSEVRQRCSTMIACVSKVLLTSDQIKVVQMSGSTGGQLSHGREAPGLLLSCSSPPGRVIKSTYSSRILYNVYDLDTRHWTGRQDQALARVAIYIYLSYPGGTLVTLGYKQRWVPGRCGG